MEAGRYYSKTCKTNVDVVKVGKAAVTIKTWGKGLKSGEIVTYRGWPKDDLEAERASSQWES